MEDFEFICPTKVIFGKGSEEKVGVETKKYGNKVLLHYGSGSIKKSGLYDKVIRSLKEQNLEITELPGVVPNPRIELVREGIKICKEKNIDIILAVGGGSVIDSAKAIGMGYYYEGDVWDFFIGKADAQNILPIGCILTLPAAGSEMSFATVISDPKTNQKIGYRNDIMRPKFALMNPELTFTLPKYQIAAGAADMLAHIFERYFSNTKYSDFTDKISEGAMRSIIKNTELALKIPENYDYRAELMWASSLAHNGIFGIGKEEDWCSHRIEHDLSAHYDITHGAGLAIIFPAWMKYVSKDNLCKFVQFGKNVWNIDEGSDEEIAQKAIEKTKDFFKRIGMPTTLKEVDIDDSKFKVMADSVCMNEYFGSFKKLYKEDIIKIFKSCLE